MNASIEPPELPNPMESGLYRTVPLAAVILSFATVAMLWGDMPATIPIHYNLKGEADGFGSKWLLWILPALNLGLFYLLQKAVTPTWQKYNVPLVKPTEENAARQRAINLQLTAQIRVVVCLLLAYIAYTSAQIAAGLQEGMNMTIFWALMGLMLLIIGVHVYRSLRAA